MSPDGPSAVSLQRGVAHCSTKAMRDPSVATDTMFMKRIRLLLIDPNVAVRKGLVMHFELEPDIEVIGQAAELASAMASIAVARPDVILLDVVASCLDGLEASIALARQTSAAPVVMLSLLDDCRTRQQTRACGVAAFVSKQDDVDRLLATIRRVAGSGDCTTTPQDRAA